MQYIYFLLLPNNFQLICDFDGAQSMEEGASNKFSLEAGTTPINFRHDVVIFWCQVARPR